MLTVFQWFQANGWSSGWIALAGGLFSLVLLTAIFLSVNRDDFL